MTPKMSWNKDDYINDLKENWANANHVISYSGISAIHNYYRGKLTKNEIKHTLSQIATYTKVAELKRPRRYNHYFVYKKDQQWQLDVAFIEELAEDNDGYKWLLFCLDVFSRRLVVAPLKSKKSSSVTYKTKQIINNSSSEPPDSFFTDSGGEFKAKIFQNMCQKKNIKLRYSTGITKAPHVERVQKTIQKQIYSHLLAHNTKRYIDVLPQIISNYNNRKHRITGFSPNEAYLEKNQNKVLRNLKKNYYNVSRKNRRVPTFEVGTPVRIQKHKYAFHRSYKQLNSSEVYKILKVHQDLPIPTYTLCEYSDPNEVIIGKFYGSELIASRSESFRIAHIIDQKGVGRKKQYLVRWEGYSARSDSWVLAKDIVPISAEN